MTNKKRKGFTWFITRTVALALIVCAVIAATNLSCSKEASDITLNVALYQWVPRYDQFEETIARAWEETGTGAKLNFVQWDCYSSDPTPELDVFVFDAAFLTYFAKKGFLATIGGKDIVNPEDILDFALQGCMLDGSFYGIPQLACTNFFFCRTDDNECAKYLNAKTLTEMYALLGDNTSPDIPPPAGQGLLADLSGGTTCACLYVDAGEDFTGVYNPDPPLPPASDLNPAVLENLHLTVRMAGPAQADYEAAESYQRAAWFSGGSGKAMMHFSESLWRMSEAARKNVTFKVMPLGSKPVNLFFLDVIGIKPGLEPEKMKSALALANVMASKEVMVKCLMPWKDDPSPQYLLPARDSVFAALGKTYVLYEALGTVVKESDPRPFRLGENSKTWLKENKKAIKAAIYDIKEKLKQEQEAGT
jgi:thiamine pyridinylase